MMLCLLKCVHLAAIKMAHFRLKKVCLSRRNRLLRGSLQNHTLLDQPLGQKFQLLLFYQLSLGSWWYATCGRTWTLNTEENLQKAVSFLALRVGGWQHWRWEFWWGLGHLCSAWRARSVCLTFSSKHDSPTANIYEVCPWGLHDVNCQDQPLLTRPAGISKFHPALQMVFSIFSEKTNHNNVCAQADHFSSSLSYWCHGLLQQFPSNREAHHLPGVQEYVSSWID